MWNVLPKFTCKFGQNDCETWNLHFIVSLSCLMSGVMSDTHDHRLATRSPGDISDYRNRKAGIPIPIIWRIKSATTAEGNIDRTTRDLLVEQVRNGGHPNRLVGKSAEQENSHTYNMESEPKSTSDLSPITTSNPIRQKMPTTLPREVDQHRREAGDASQSGAEAARGGRSDRKERLTHELRSAGSAQRACHGLC
jgi:hypothetical protein